MWGKFPPRFSPIALLYFSNAGNQRDWSYATPSWVQPGAI